MIALTGTSTKAEKSSETVCRFLTPECEVRMSVQYFGNTSKNFRFRDRSPQGTSTPEPPALWCLLRQDLYLDEQSAPFLIVHWQHTFDFGNLLDVIPGEQTQQIDGNVKP